MEYVSLTVGIDREMEQDGMCRPFSRGLKHLEVLNYFLEMVVTALVGLPGAVSLSKSIC
jgi:hypothetical protein